MKPLYHGGIPGLNPGSKLLPPSVTGQSTLLEISKQIAPDGPQRSDRVYVTTDFTAALLFAACYPNGDVYEVMPIGELEHDPDCTEHGYGFQCKEALIVRVAASKNPTRGLFAMKFADAMKEGMI